MKNKGLSFFKRRVREWYIEFNKYKYLILLSVFLVLIAIYVDYHSGVYVTNADVTAVNDLILDHIPPINLSFLFVYVYLAIMFIYFLYPLFFRIENLHKAIFQFSILLLIRSFFLIFTHLQTPVDVINTEFPWILKGLYFQNDLFFSGHTAIPFLGFLMFKNKKVKYFFLVSSLVMGATVLLMHQHYSIDVFSAFFIAYGSYHIGDFVLKELDKRLIRKS